MWMVVLGVIFLIEAVLIIKWKVASTALIYYMETKGYTQPNSEEMAVCTKSVVERMIKDLFCWR